VRRLPVTSSTTGVKRNGAGPDELISAVLVTPRPGPQAVLQDRYRNAMVIAVAAFGLALHPTGAPWAPGSARRADAIGGG